MLWYEVAMKSLFSFQGTISRSRFWLQLLALFVAIFLLAILSELLEPAGTIGAICVLVLFVVFGVWWQFALYAKRLRDAGLSPWLCLLLFVPLANFVVLLIAGVKPTAVEMIGAPTR